MLKFPFFAIFFIVCLHFDGIFSVEEFIPIRPRRDVSMLEEIVYSEEKPIKEVTPQTPTAPEGAKQKSGGSGRHHGAPRRESVPVKERVAIRHRNVAIQHHRPEPPRYQPQEHRRKIIVERERDESASSPEREQAPVFRRQMVAHRNRPVARYPEERVLARVDVNGAERRSPIGPQFVIDRGDESASSASEYYEDRHVMPGPMMVRQWPRFPSEDGTAQERDWYGPMIRHRRANYSPERQAVSPPGRKWQGPAVPAPAMREKSSPELKREHVRVRVPTPIPRHSGAGTDRGYYYAASIEQPGKQQQPGKPEKRPYSRRHRNDDSRSYRSAASAYYSYELCPHPDCKDKPRNSNESGYRRAKPQRKQAKFYKNVKCCCRQVIDSCQPFQCDSQSPSSAMIQPFVQCLKDKQTCGCELVNYNCIATCRQ